MKGLVERLRPLLSRHEELRLALLFGSRARDGGRPDSDIDLALLGEDALAPATVIDIVGAVGAEFGTAVDVVDLHHAPEPVTGEALQGVRILGADATFAELLIRHLDNVEDFIPLQRRILDERGARWLR